MLRRTWALLGGVLLVGTLALTGFAGPDDKPGAKTTDKPAAVSAPAGTWKVRLPLSRAGTDALWLVRFESKEGGWSGKVIAVGEKADRSEMTSVALKDGALQFTIKMGDARFDCKVRVPSTDAAKLMGGAAVSGNVQPVELERTT